MESGLDNDLDNKDLDEIEVLIIDILSPPSTILNNENSEAFFTLLSLVKKAEKMAAALANRLFSHFLFTIDKVFPNATCNIIDSGLFAYIITNGYLSDKFYGIIIDINVSKYSIPGYRQYITYTKDIKDMTINISKADAIHIQFDIGSISSIRFVLIQIPIGHIKFHIVKTATFFLLCLANMNYLGIYFNNIDNLLVIKSIHIPIIRCFDQSFLLC